MAAEQLLVHLLSNNSANSGSYTTQTWTNGQITWTATDARKKFDQLLNATRAITIKMDH
jgi:hypothetical protein